MWLVGAVETRKRERGVSKREKERKFIVHFVGYFRLTIVQAINERLGY